RQYAGRRRARARASGDGSRQDEIRVPLLRRRRPQPRRSRLFPERRTVGRIQRVVCVREASDCAVNHHPRSYKWRAEDGDHVLELVPVAGTNGDPYLFGSAPNRRPTDVGDFCIMSTPVTQALWTHVTGAAPSSTYHPRRPVDSISWDGITGPGGFLERINASVILPSVAGSSAALRFRLPSETEWEYAARGGPRWRDEFRFSGSDDVDEVGWYCARFSAWRRLIVQVLGWKRGWRLVNRPPGKDATHVHDVALKK